MFYLIRRKVSQNLEIWETDHENDLVVNFIQLLHIGGDEVDNNIMRAIMRDKITHEPLEKTTTIVHLRGQIVACSDSFDALVGAAAMENLTPVADSLRLPGF
jgi:hypothetical protein